MQINILSRGEIRTDGAEPYVLSPLLLAIVIALVQEAPVSSRRLAELLWAGAEGDWRGDEPSVAANLRQVKSRLGKLLGDRLVARDGVWRLEWRAGDWLDLDVFLKLVYRAAIKGADDPRVAGGLFEYALQLWSVPHLSRIVDQHPLMRGVLDGLLKVRLTAIKQAAEIRLMLGDHAALADELRDLAQEYPEEEYLLVLCMRSLAGAFRRPEALRLYRAHEIWLREEFGTEPTPPLQELYNRILTNDKELLPVGDVPELAPDAAVRRAGGDAEQITPTRMTGYMMGEGAEQFNTWRDRLFTEIMGAVCPGVLELSWASERLCGRFVRRLVETTQVRDFLEVGAPLSTNQYLIHNVARLMEASVNVVYTQRDRSLVRHFAERIKGERVALIHANLSEPDELLRRSELRPMIDAGRPMALICREELNYTPGAEMYLGRLAARLPIGSHMLLVTASDDISDLAAAQLAYIYNQPAAIEVVQLRSRNETAEMCPPGWEIRALDDTYAVLSDAPRERPPWRALGMWAEKVRSS